MSSKSVEIAAAANEASRAIGVISITVDLPRVPKKQVVLCKSLQVRPTRLESDLRVIHDWNDEDHEYSFEEFHLDVLQCGCIVIFKTMEDIAMMEKLGVSGGVKALIPETTEWHQFGKERWLRVDVVYNESFAMIFYIARDVSNRVSVLIRKNVELDSCDG